MNMIRTQGLTKRFGAITAVDDLDLDVREGDVYGFLGANGSGKTTTVRMLLGLVLATKGGVQVLGRPMPRYGREVLPQVGALVESPAAYPRDTKKRPAEAVKGKPAVGEVGFLAQGDHRLHDAAQFLGLGQSGGDDLVLEQRVGHVAQHRQAMAAGSVELAQP